MPQHQGHQHAYTFADPNGLPFDHAVYGNNNAQGQNPFASLVHDNDHGRVSSSDFHQHGGSLQGNSFEPNHFGQASPVPLPNPPSGIRRDIAIQQHASPSPDAEYTGRVSQGARTDFSPRGVHPAVPGPAHHHGILYHDQMPVNPNQHALMQDSAAARMQQLMPPVQGTPTHQPVAAQQYAHHQQVSFSPYPTASPIASRTSTPSSTPAAAFGQNPPYVRAFPPQTTHGYDSPSVPVNALVAPPSNPGTNIAAGTPYSSLTPQQGTGGQADPVFTPIEGCPSISFSNTPDPTMMVTETSKRSYDKPVEFVFNSIKNRGKILPNRTKRLPGEILRDYGDLSAKEAAMNKPEDTMTQTEKATKARVKQDKEQLKAELADVNPGIDVDSFLQKGESSKFRRTDRIGIGPRFPSTIRSLDALSPGAPVDLILTISLSLVPSWIMGLDYGISTCFIPFLLCVVF